MKQKKSHASHQWSLPLLWFPRSRRTETSGTRGCNRMGIGAKGGNIMDKKESSLLRHTCLYQ